MTNKQTGTSGLVEVTQADRDAAAAYLDQIASIGGLCEPGSITQVRDDHPAVQALARHRLASLSPVPVDEVERLTPAYRAMSPLEKWETLVLNGLIGTNEPWIEDMRQSLAALSSLVGEK